MQKSGLQIRNSMDSAQDQGKRRNFIVPSEIIQGVAKVSILNRYFARLSVRTFVCVCVKFLVAYVTDCTILPSHNVHLTHIKFIINTVESNRKPKFHIQQKTSI